jgi:hypothetical protein
MAVTTASTIAATSTAKSPARTRTTTLRNRSRPGDTFGRFRAERRVVTVIDKVPTKH